MFSVQSDHLDYGHGLLILGGGLVDSSLIGEVGLIETIDLPICGISALERILIRDKTGLPTWIHLKASNDDFEAYLRDKFPNIVGFSYSSDENEEGLRISAIVSLKAASNYFSSIDLVFADTWQDCPEGADVISVQTGSVKEVYTGVKRDKNRMLEFRTDIFDFSITGFFRFSDPKLFLKLLQDQQDNNAEGFYSAIKDYDWNLEGKVKLEVANNWYDFGHKDSFYESRRHWLLGRSFNNISASDNPNRITKASIHEEKLIHEFYWYKKLPPEVHQYVPEVWQIEGESRYEIEFIPSPSLAEILVFGNMNLGFWDNTMIQIEKYFSTINEITIDEVTLADINSARKQMYIDKVIERTKSLFGSPNFNEFVKDQNPFMKRISFRGKELPKFNEVLEIYLSLVKREINTSEQGPKLIHGDLCFGNMIFNNGNLKVVDPRGTFGHIKLAGDLYYDYAKLAHSIFGEYDYFAFDRFIISRNKAGYDAIPIKKGESDTILNSLRSNFSNIMLEHGIDSRKVTIIMAGIFLSIASLHKESAERQLSLLLIGMSEVVKLAETGYR